MIWSLRSVWEYFSKFKIHFLTYVKLMFLLKTSILDLKCLNRRRVFIFLKFSTTKENLSEWRKWRSSSNKNWPFGSDIISRSGEKKNESLIEAFNVEVKVKVKVEAFNVEVKVKVWTWDKLDLCSNHHHHNWHHYKFFWL